MLRQHLFLAFRNFKKTKSSFIINLLGLSVGLACTLLIYLWVNDELKVDQLHQYSDRIYQVMEHQSYNQEIMTTSSTPGILSDALSEEIPEIQYAVTTTWINKFTVSTKDINIKANGFYVGKDYLKIFSYPLIQGLAEQALVDKSSIALSESLAKQLFGNEDAMGKSIDFQHEKTFKVSAIFKDIPPSSSYRFDFLLPMEVTLDENEWMKEWGNNGPPTYVLLREGSKANVVSDKIANFIVSKNEDTNVTLFLQKYTDRYLYGKYENGQLVGGRIEYVKLFSIIALFILAIACINFMNLSTANASKRAREVGVKKAVGAGQNSLIMQFLTESIVLSVLSMIVAVCLVALLIPQFNLITSKSISLQFSSELIAAIVLTSLATGLIAGSYPAFYLSNFAPVKVLKGEVKTSIGELWARRGLVIFQFFLSIVFIVSVIVIYKQVEFVQNKYLGYNQDQVIYVEMEGKVSDDPTTFLQEVKKMPGVVNASTIGHSLMGRQMNSSGLVWKGKDPDVDILFENVGVNHGLIETMAMEMKEGRAFSKDFSTDTSSIILNEAAVKIMGFENPIGENIKLWEQYDLTVIGVVKDFHFQSLHEQINPLFMRLIPENTWNVVIRLDANHVTSTVESLSQFYSDYNPGFIFDYKFMDAEYDAQYASEQRVATLSKYFAFIAILISCLGLLGLASFTAQRRLKEIGIRKVLGSTSVQIVYLLSSDFSKMVLFSVLLALPFSYFALQNWLDKFQYKISLQWWYFIAAGASALLIAWFTVGSQALKAASTNPVNCLKDE